MDNLARSCALECALWARPRAGPGAMAAGHPVRPPSLLPSAPGG